MPVRLSGLRLSHCIGTPAAIAAHVREHYRLQTLVLVSRIVGSMPNLGNPLGLLSRCPPCPHTPHPPIPPSPAAALPCPCGSPRARLPARLGLAVSRGPRESALSALARKSRVLLRRLSPPSISAAYPPSCRAGLPPEPCAVQAPRPQIVARAACGGPEALCGAWGGSAGAAAGLRSRASSPCPHTPPRQGYAGVPRARARADESGGPARARAGQRPARAPVAPARAGPSPQGWGLIRASAPRVPRGAAERRAGLAAPAGFSASLTSGRSACPFEPGDRAALAPGDRAALAPGDRAARRGHTRLRAARAGEVGGQRDGPLLENRLLGVCGALRTRVGVDGRRVCCVGSQRACAEDARRAVSAQARPECLLAARSGLGDVRAFFLGGGLTLVGTGQPVGGADGPLPAAGPGARRRTLAAARHCRTGAPEPSRLKPGDY